MVDLEPRLSRAGWSEHTPVRYWNRLFLKLLEYVGSGVLHLQDSPYLSTGVQPPGHLACSCGSWTCLSHVLPGRQLTQNEHQTGEHRSAVLGLEAGEGGAAKPNSGMVPRALGASLFFPRGWFVVSRVCTSFKNHIQGVWLWDRVSSGPRAGAISSGGQNRKRHPTRGTRRTWRLKGTVHAQKAAASTIWRVSLGTDRLGLCSPTLFALGLVVRLSSRTPSGHDVGGLTVSSRKELPVCAAGRQRTVRPSARPPNTRMRQA